MDIDRAVKSELLRLTSTKWRKQNTERRWEYMCEMHDTGACWAAMGRAIDRHYTTAKKLWKRGWLERQKKVCNCHVCGTHLPKITTYPRYVEKERTVVHSTPGIKPDVVVFGGPCPKCKCNTWSQAFKPESYEIGAKWK